MRRAAPAWAASWSQGCGDVSRIGKQPVALPDGVEITIEPELVSVKGPKGELAERKSRDIAVKQEEGQILVSRPTDRGEHRALHGLTRSLIANMVEGVTTGFEKRLEIQGVGYRAALRGSDLELALGYSHPVSVKAPAGIEFEVPMPTRIVVKGNSKQASEAGKLLAERAKAAGIERAVFDRGGYQYHGRVQAFAEGVREGGLAV